MGGHFYRRRQRDCKTWYHSYLSLLFCFHCTALHCIALYCTVRDCTVPYPTALYYTTVLVIVHKACETSTNIPRYWTVGYCTVPWASSSCYNFSFLSSYWKRLKKVKLDNKSLIRCFGVKYRHIFLLVVCTLTRTAGSSKYSTTRKNIRRYFTPKHLIRYMSCIALHCIAWCIQVFASNKY